MKIKFSKYQGCGNDFIIINNLDNSIRLNKKQIKNLCDRHFGIGADGLILVETRDGDFYMNYFNADGSLAEMCGNGMRCVAQFLNDNLDLSDSILIKSLSGSHNVQLEPSIKVSLPKESYKYEEIGLETDDLKGKFHENGKDYIIDYVSMGNPHGVVILDNFNEISDQTAQELTKSSNLKNGANINFVRVLDKDNIEVRTCERGDGFTLACGTGACASAVVSHNKGLTSEDVNVYIPGGCLSVELTGKEILLSGPAVKVFSGEVIV